MDSEVTAAVQDRSLAAPSQNVTGPAFMSPGRRSWVLQLGMMAKFGTAEVLQWLETVKHLTEPQRAAIKDRFVGDEYIGQDLLDWNERNLPKALRGTGATEAAPLLLAARDKYLADCLALTGEQ